MWSMDLYTLLIRSADAGIEQIQDSRHMEPGHNGPYHDPETPVRNTSHWTITFLTAYKITGDDRYLDAVEKCLSYLMSDKVRPHGHTFRHRNIDGKDACNGLIGQAWTIEALAMAGGELDRQEPLNVAKSVFLQHPFSNSLGAWKVVEVDGTTLGYDLTLNHQIWFAAAGAQIVENDDSADQIESVVRTFLDELQHNMHQYSSGLIYHNLRPTFNTAKYSILALENFKRRRVPMPILENVRAETKQNLKNKAIGYHSFNLYGLALLKQVYPDHGFWSCRKFLQTLEFIQSGQFKNALETNPYGYPYNCSGIEIAFATHVFENDIELIQKWLSNQFKHNYDLETEMLTKNTEDPVTLASRIYEATRLPNVSIDIDY